MSTDGLTPLAFLLPNVTSQLEAQTCLTAFTLGAYVWDILCHLREECMLFRKGIVSVSTSIYFTARLSALVFVLSTLIFESANIEDCRAFSVAIGWISIIRLLSTSALFHLRIRSITHANYWIVTFYTVLWLGDVGTSFIIPLAVSASRIGLLQQCVNTTAKPFVSYSFLVNTIHDTFVYLGIALSIAGRIESHYPGSFTGLGIRWRPFWKGESMAGLIKSAWKDGQSYYLITLTFNLATIFIMFNTSIPPIVRGMVVTPSNALETAMACRLFREINRCSYLASNSDTAGETIVTSSPILPTSLRQFPVDSNTITRLDLGRTRSRSLKKDVYKLSRLSDTPAVVHVKTEVLTVYDDMGFPVRDPAISRNAVHGA